MRKILVALLLCSVARAAAANDNAPAIQERFVSLKDGTQIHMLEAGKPSAVPALVFIPGWTLPAFLWKEQMQKFAADRLVIAVDPRSQGDSSKTDLGNTPEQRARDLHEILAARKIERIVLVGWSQGSQDVAAYILQFGTDSLAAVAFVDSPVAGGPAEIELNKELSRYYLGMFSTYVNHPAEFSAGMVKSMFKKPPPEQDLQRIIAHARKTPVNTGLTMLVMDLFAVDRRPALAKLNRPTLVIAASDSPLLEVQKEMARTIPGAEFVVAQESAHAVFIDQPEIFSAALQRLIDAAAKSP